MFCWRDRSRVATCSLVSHKIMKLANGRNVATYSAASFLWETMAVTLSATLFSTTIPPKRNTNCASTRVISNLNIGSLLPNLNSCKRLIKFSPRQSHVVASAVSGSPGKFSFSNSLFGFPETDGKENNYIFVIYFVVLVRGCEQRPSLLWTVKMQRVYWRRWRCLIWMEMEFRFRICGKIGQLSSHLLAISGNVLLSFA